MSVKNKTEITIGIPCYNASSTIYETLLSIKNQTVEPYEILIIDDASTEDYTKIFKDFKNIRHIKLRENNGVGNARREIINNCKTKYVTMLDADDTFYAQDVLEELNNIILEKECDFIVTATVYQDYNNQQHILNTYDRCHGKVYNTEFMKEAGINFSTSRTHEEGCVNWYLRERKSTLIERFDLKTYVWKWNKNSITNTVPIKSIGYRDYIDALADAYKNIKKDRKIDYVSTKKRAIADVVCAHGIYTELVQEYGRNDKDILENKEKLINYIKSLNIADWFIHYPNIQYFSEEENFLLQYFSMLRSSKVFNHAQQLFVKENIFEFISKEVQVNNGSNEK